MFKLKNYNVIKNEQQCYHLVDVSPWPLMVSISLLSLVLSFICYFQYKFPSYNLILSFIFFCFYVFRWFSDIIVESTFEGHHTQKVQKGIRLGMCLFIVSEIMFFFSFFWSFFHCSLAPSMVLGIMWPPKSIIVLDTWGLPLWNTIILLSSGVTITCAHRAMLFGERMSAINGILFTVVYGLLFTIIQCYEYNVAPYSINDSIFGSLFFVCTGFHGFHVLIGTIFLIVCLIRQINYHFTRNQHVGFEAAVWYWHFVDVVWLFLFCVIYIWGGNW